MHVKFLTITVFIFIVTILPAQAECRIKHCLRDEQPHYPSITTQIRAKELDELHKTITYYLNNKYDIQLSTEFNNSVYNMLNICTKKYYATQYLAEVSCNDAIYPIEYELRLVAEEILN